MRITVCEMPDDQAEFARQWERLSAHVSRASSDLVLLPEMPFYYWVCASPKFDAAKWNESVREHRRWIARLGELGAPVVLGSRAVERGGRRLNEGFVWTEKGGAKGVHYKNYLPNEKGFFEASWYARGDRAFVPFEAGGWKVGFMICSDIWAMANARAFGKQGVGLLAVPRATPVSSLEKWVAGGRVAAVLAGAYCASSNRNGVRGDAHFGGRGWVADPNGIVLGLTSGGRPFVTVTIDRARANRAKTTYPRDALEPD